MQWTPGGSREDLEDRRAEGGGGGGFGFGGMHLGIGGTVVVLVLSFIFKTNLFTLFSGDPGSRTSVSAPANPTESPGEQREVDFVAFVLNDTQRTWDSVLPKTGTPYHHAKLVLFRDITESACGTAQSATGPFYCPGDEKVYIDLGFFDQLRSQFGAPGEFAQAYVIAHEIGHHVQRLLGTERKVRQLQRGQPGAANQLSVRMELQADCYAGVWGNSTEQRKIVNESDVAEGLRAAASVGDDRLQRMSRGSVSPESFTHGS
ncbi:MAG TPA: neutral zinc metallopeptidase, partial [Bryobacteraceae bacterium]|nr:neutral zinc metallopeptidase [Bryobacteraceae bacterium]